MVWFSYNIAGHILSHKVLKQRNFFATGFWFVTHFCSFLGQFYFNNNMQKLCCTDKNVDPSPWEVSFAKHLDVFERWGVTPLTNTAAASQIINIDFPKQAPINLSTMMELHIKRSGSKTRKVSQHSPHGHSSYIPIPLQPETGGKQEISSQAHLLFWVHAFLYPRQYSTHFVFKHTVLFTLQIHQRRQLQLTLRLDLAFTGCNLIPVPWSPRWTGILPPALLPAAYF